MNLRCKSTLTHSVDDLHYHSIISQLYFHKLIREMEWCVICVGTRGKNIDDNPLVMYHAVHAHFAVPENLEILVW